MVVVMVLALPAVKVRAADEFTKVPVLVNVLKGVVMSDDDIDDMIKEANKILKQAKIQLEFDKDKNVKNDVNDTGNDDGNIQSGEEAKLDEDGRKELDNKFGNGKGVKIYITNEIRDDPDRRGLAPHVKEKNGKLMANPAIYLKKTTATKKSKGNDLAHECGHVFTLGKCHVIDKAAVRNADDTAHDPSDPNNLMYPYNPYDKDGNSIDRGGELTDDQIEEIKKGAKRLGKTKVAKKPKKGGSSAYVIATMQTIHGGFVDGLYDAIPQIAYADLGAGFLFAETPTSLLEISILTGGLMPVDASPTVTLYVDSDGNTATGEQFTVNAGGSVFNGIDSRIDAQIWGDSVFATISLVGGSGSKFLPGARLDRIAKILDSNDPCQPTVVTDYVDGIYIPVPIESLGFMGDFVPIYVTSDDFETSAYDEAFFVLELDKSSPKFQLENTLLAYGEPMDYSGSGFTPLSDVHILLDDTQLCTVQSDASGNINGSYWATFAEDMATYNDFFFITARDDVSGGFDYSIIELEGNSANLNCDTIVDWTDFAIFAAEWLSPDWPSYTGYCDQP
jgi:hypothetical protein